VAPAAPVPAARRDVSETPRPEDDEPTDEAVVDAASEAAEGVVLSRYKQSAVTDLDVTVSFEEGVLEVDVYLNAPDEPDPEAVANEAIEAAEDAVDELFEG